MNVANSRDNFLLEVRRQIVHAAGIGYLPAVLYFGREFVIAALAVQIIVFLFLGMLIRSGLVLGIRNIVYRVERKGVFPFSGVIYWAFGAVSVLILFPLSVAFAGIAVLAIGDAVSTLVGRYHGQHKLPINRKKSWEGSVSFFISSVIVLCFFVSPILAILVSLATAFIETFPKVNDNVTIPLSAGFLIFVFG